MNQRIRKKIKSQCMHLCFEIDHAGRITAKNRKRLITLLKLWSRVNDVPGMYGYTGDPIPHIAYCADRMNSGRARAILRLLNAPSKSLETANNEIHMRFGYDHLQ